MALASLAFVALPTFAAHPNTLQNPAAKHPSVFAQEHPRAVNQKLVPAATAATSCVGSTTANMVISATEGVQNDSDSGMVGYWALDKFVRIIKVYNTGPDQWCVTETFNGSFAAAAGQVSPGNTCSPSCLLTGDEVGHFTGNVLIFITGQLDVSNPTVWPVRGNVNGGGYVDYQCDMSGNCPGYQDWTKQYFNTKDINFTFAENIWRFAYSGHDAPTTPDAGTPDGTWVNAYNGNSGDIVDRD